MKETAAMEFHSRELIEASAGTGKTQALAERLITLLKRGVKPQEIVALTFSRAAAGEIFERFVTLLADTAEKELASLADGANIADGANGSRQFAASFVADGANIADGANGSRQFAASSLADGANGVSESAKLLREVIATQHLSQIGTLDSFLMRMVRAFPLELGLQGEVELLDDYEADSEANRVSFSLLRRTDAKTARAFVDAFSLAMNREDPRSFVDSYRKFIKTWHDRIAAHPVESAWGDPKTIWGRVPRFASVGAAELAAAADRLLPLVDTDAWRDFAAWVRAFRGSFTGVKGLAKKFLELDNAFDGASIGVTYNRKPYEFNGEECEIVRTALGCVYGYVVRMRLELARGIFALVSEYEKVYGREVRGRGRLVFADIPRLIAALPPEARLSLEYRLDSRLRAWALDEFQDTSREQWQVLAPLLEEAKQSDDGKSVFIVGDRKQAIYGWRNGDVKIFEGEKASRDGRGRNLYALGELVKSWRFGPAVTEAVNRVFSGGMIREEFPAWRSPEHESAKPDLTGFVQTVDAAGPKMADFVDPVFNALRAVDPVGRGLSAAILVRANTFGEYLAAELKRRGLDGVIWEGESDVLDTPALAGFLDLVQLADHPGDMLTYRHFLLTPLAAARYPDGVPCASALSNEFSLAFTTRGLVRVFRELRALFPENPDEAWNRFTESRFTDMLRAAAEFELSDRPDLRLADFPRYLESRTRRTLAEPGRIKVMTIHRSKGLGFDYVVLPLYEHTSLNAEPTGPLEGEGWTLPDPGARVARVVGGLESAYRERRDRAEQEALCIYYVAMTRAKRALTMVLHPHSDSAAGTRFSDLVRASLPDPLGTPDWYLPPASESQTPLSNSNSTLHLHLQSTPNLSPPPRSPRTVLRRRLPSKKYQSGQSAGLLFLSNLPRKAAMERGTSVHAEYEQVEFNDWITKPEGFTGLWRERAFEVVVDGVWTSGRFDRVVFCGDHAIIQDYKTGRKVDPEIYRGQMIAYRKALSVLTGLPEASISLELLLVDTRETIRL